MHFVLHGCGGGHLYNKFLNDQAELEKSLLHESFFRTIDQFVQTNGKKQSFGPCVIISLKNILFSMHLFPDPFSLSAAICLTSVLTLPKRPRADLRFPPFCTAAAESIESTERELLL
jgi:hypothetical protein